MAWPLIEGAMIVMLCKELKYLYVECMIMMMRQCYDMLDARKGHLTTQSKRNLRWEPQLHGDVVIFPAIYVFGPCLPLHQQGLSYLIHKQRIIVVYITESGEQQQKW